MDQVALVSIMPPNPVPDVSRFATLLDRHKVGDRISVGVIRNGKAHILFVTLQAA